MAVSALFRGLVGGGFAEEVVVCGSRPATAGWMMGFQRVFGSGGQLLNKPAAVIWLGIDRGRECS